MDISLTITIIGTVLTAIGTFVTLYQSARVKRLKNEILEDVNRVNLVEVYELLKSAQIDTRKILFPSSQIARGSKVDEVISSIQKNIDESLCLINLDEKDRDLRTKVINAQTKLRDYSKGSGVTYKENCINEFHILLQDSISLTKTKANKILGK